MGPVRAIKIMQYDISALSEMELSRRCNDAGPAELPLSCFNDGDEWLTSRLTNILGSISTEKRIPK